MNNTPKLRFKEFIGDWESKKLYQISDVLSGKRVPKGMNLVEYNTGIPYVTVSDMGDKYVDISKLRYITTEIEEHIKKYKVFTNDIIISVAGTLGKINLIQNELENANLTENCDKITNLKNINYKYLYYYLNTEHIQNQISSVNTISSQPKLALACIRDFDISIPSLEEQEKIASYFSLIDDKISLQGEKVEALKEYKKGIMQKIFRRELRFKDDEGRDYPEWEKKKLGDYIIEYKEKTTENNQYPPLTSSRKGLFLQSDYFDKQIASTDNTGYNIVPRNYFTYRHMSDDAMFFFNINNLVDYGIVSTLYPVFTTSDKLDSIFLRYYLNESNEFKKYSLLQKQGGSRTYMYLSKLKEFKIKLPTIEEQNKIVKLLVDLENKLNKEQEKLDSLNEYKKGLLQQMFV